MNRSIRVYWMLATTTFVMISSAGCRSNAPRMNLFSMRSKPSAEALAGNGPSATYPLPPSATAKPEAIASIAAGMSPSDGPITAPAKSLAANPTQLAGMDIDPGYVSPASSHSPVTNMSAAQANGILGADQPSGYAASSSQSSSSGPSGYVFGSRSSQTPPPNSSFASSPTSTTPSQPPSADGANSPSAPTPPAAESLASGFGVPPGMNDGTTVQPASIQGSDISAGGFTMPDDIPPAVASVSPQAASPSFEALPSSLPPAADEPDYTMATSDFSRPTIDTSAPQSAPSTTSGGYSPGSTAGAIDYPTGPSTGTGSFYR